MDKIALRIHVCADDWAAERTIIASNKLRYSSNNENPCLISEIYDSLISKGTCDKMLRDNVGRCLQNFRRSLRKVAFSQLLSIIEKAVLYQDILSNLIFPPDSSNENILTFVRNFFYSRKNIQCFLTVYFSQEEEPL